MKLIIDIEPRYCRDMQSNVKELYYEAINHITEAVRNGKPYDERSHGDLISREALKEVLKECAYSYDGVNTWIMKDEVLGIIDNAPTIPLPDFKEGYKQAIIDGKTNFSRPQGEPVIKCQDCKYRVKEWREDRRMKEKGYWVYGCKHFGEIIGFWGFGGNDNEFCSDAERKGGTE